MTAPVWEVDSPEFDAEGRRQSSMYVPKADPKAEPHKTLDFRTPAEQRAINLANGKRHWLIEGMWMENTGMVVGAQAKLGKSFAMLDLAVSIASGTPWMNTFKVCRTGAVTFFHGEDDEYEVMRRLDAIAESKGVDPDTLEVFLCRQVPNLSNQASLKEMAAHLADNPCVAALLDPLYLAAGDKADGANLYAMGGVLRAYGDVCRATNTAPGIIHHWTKGGTGTGSERFSGTGIQQWARTLISGSSSDKPTIDVVPIASEDGETIFQKRVTQVIKWEFSGNSLVEESVSVRRRIWAHDPTDMDSPLHYEIEPAETAPVTATSPLTPSPLTAAARSLKALQDCGEPWADKSFLQDWDARHAPVKRGGEVAGPMRPDTVFRSMEDHVRAGTLISCTVGIKKLYALPGTPLPPQAQEAKAAAPHETDDNPF